MEGSKAWAVRVAGEGRRGILLLPGQRERNSSFDPLFNNKINYDFTLLASPHFYLSTELKVSKQIDILPAFLVAAARSPLAT